MSHAHAHHPSFAWLDARLDRFAIGLSGLCAVHCIASSVLLALASAAGGMLLNPLFHEVGLVMAIGFGIMALWRGFLTHDYLLPLAVGSAGLGIMAGAMRLPHEGGQEAIWTIVGVLVLALGHDLNRRATY